VYGELKIIIDEYVCVMLKSTWNVSLL